MWIFLSIFVIAPFFTVFVLAVVHQITDDWLKTYLLAITLGVSLNVISYIGTRGTLATIIGISGALLAAHSCVKLLKNESPE